MSNLAAVLQARFELTGDLAALEESTALLRRALEAVPPEHPLRASLMSNLAAVLQARFELTGDLAALEESIALLRRALEAVPPEHRISANLHNNLSVALLHLYVEGGDSGYLDEAVDAARRAVALSPADHPQKAGYLSNLGAALRSRYDRTGDLRDLHDAIDAAEMAFSSGAGSQPDRAVMQFNLGAALLNRFEAVGEPNDLDRAIELHRMAVTITSVGDPKRGDYLLDLGGSLRARFLAGGDPSDLERALDAVSAAIMETPPNEPRAAAYLSSLADLRFIRYSRDSDINDAETAIEMWQRASAIHAAGVSVRLKAARSWGSAAAALGRWNSAAEGYASAVSLLPLLVWRGMDRADRAWLLGQWAGVASDAAACMVNAGMPERALETLEAGRSVLWSELLGFETDLSSLRQLRPDLASLLTRIRNEIDDIGSTAANVGEASPSEIDRTSSPLRDRRLGLARQWDRLVAEVRMLPGLESFMRTPRLPGLLSAAAGGPVVVVNVSQWRCDALIVSSSGVQVVRLPRLTLSEIVGRVRESMEALSVFQDDGAEITGFVRRERMIIETLEWLWDTVAEPVTSALGYSDSPAEGSTWPHVWWCPTGPLALLPLHAAGRVQDGTADGLLDRVISSYTPTLRSLLQARTRHVSQGDSHLSRRQLLLVSMPSTPGLPSLPGVRRERDIVSALLNQDELILLEGKAATRRAVSHALKDCSWVHFSCHGAVDLNEPAQSSLQLYDGRLTVADIVSSRGLSRGEFAFLSISEAAHTGVALPDESLSLASAFHHVGWRHVIAPLWQVRDEVAADIAAEVYRAIVEDGRLNVSQSSTALHHALRKLREVYPQIPSVWASYIHSGP
jgi:tetratricopeptide (TPR) repeat protein